MSSPSPPSRYALSLMQRIGDDAVTLDELIAQGRAAADVAATPRVRPVRGYRAQLARHWKDVLPTQRAGPAPDYHPPPRRRSPTRRPYTSRPSRAYRQSVGEFVWARFRDEHGRPQGQVGPMLLSDILDDVTVRLVPVYEDSPPMAVKMWDIKQYQADDESDGSGSGYGGGSEEDGDASC